MAKIIKQGDDGQWKEASCEYNVAVAQAAENEPMALTIAGKAHTIMGGGASRTYDRFIWNIFFRNVK